MNPNEPEEKLVIDKKLSETIGLALALVIGSVGKEIGEEKLHNSLRSILSAAQSRPKIPPEAVEIASYALFYLEAQLPNHSEDASDQHKH